MLMNCKTKFYFMEGEEEEEGLCELLHIYFIDEEEELAQEL